VANLKDYVRIARPDHWIKQLFIFPGTAFALFLVKEVTLAERIIPIILSFVATSFIASANYVINEWLDAEFDQFHPNKNQRPVVSGNINLTGVLIEYSILTILGFVCSLLISKWVFFMELWLWIMGIVYNVKPMRSKEIPYLDVLSESVNNAIRLLIGWFAITSNHLPPVSIILGYWMGGAFLMATKRFSEYRMIGDKQAASLYRKSFKFYSEKSLLISAFFYALMSVFFSGVFMIKYRAELILDIPLICCLFCIYFYLSFEKNSSAQKPEKLFKEKYLMLYLIIILIITCVLLIVDIPWLNWITKAEMINL